MAGSGSRFTAVGVAAAVLCGSSIGATVGQGQRALQIRPYRPAFDVLDYALTLDLPDRGATIRGHAVVTVVRTGSADSLTLDLLDLNVDRVTVDGRSTRFSRTSDALVIPLSRKRGATPTYRVAIDYGGTVTDGLIVRRDSGGRWTYFGDNWPNRGRHWIPSVDHPSDKATVTWTVLAPEGRTVVANGKLVSRRAVSSASGTRRVETVWRESKPIPVYLMVIAAAPLTEYAIGATACGHAEGQRCLPQFVYTAPEQRDFLPGPFARVGEMVQLFARLVGPFPYEKLAHLQSSTRFGGMENASAIFYSDAGFRNRTMGERVIAHETAHQWFGDAVTERDWPHLWLSEGFATYFAALWARSAHGDSAFRDAMSRIRQTVLGDAVSVPRRPVIDTIETDLMELLNRNSYEKGGFVLHMLRKQIGERAFFDGVSSYYRKHRHGTAVTDDLRKEMEAASRQKLAWFFDQWLRRPGYPSVTATWSWYAAAREAVIEFVQDGSHGEFEFPLAVEFVDSAGARTRASARLMPGSPSTRIRIPLATPPTAVVLDPDVDLLAVMRVVPR